MKTMFDLAGNKLASVQDGLRKVPVLYRSLGLILTLALYLGGLVVLDALSGGVNAPLVIGALYFLPAVLRAWLLFYWAVRDEVRAGKPHRERHA